KNTRARGASRRRSAHNHHCRSATRITRRDREVIVAIQDLSRSLQPVLDESSLNVKSRVTLNSKHGVAPARMTTLGKAPPLGKSSSTDEGSGTVDDNHFTMGAVIRTKPIVPAQWVIPLNTSASLRERLEITLGSGEAAEGVYDKPNFDSSASAFGQYFKQPPCDLASMKNVGFDIDTALCLAQACQLQI